MASYADQILGPHPLSVGTGRGIMSQHARPGLRSEEDRLEFKRAFDGSRRAWCRLLVEIVAMANTRGGVIVSGVSDDGSRVGIPHDLAGDLEPTRVLDQIRRYSPGARIETESLGFGYYGRDFCCIRVRAAEYPIVFDKDGQYEDPPGTPRIAFHAGVMYVRDGAGRRPISQHDLIRKVDQTGRALAEKFLARVRHQVVEPTSVGVHTSPEGELVPSIAAGESVDPIAVRLVDTTDPDVPIIADPNPDIPFASVDAEVRAAIRLARSENSGISVGRRQLANWYLRRNEVTWTPESATFALRAACAHFGFACYWASLLAPDELVRIIRDETFLDSHPECTYAPHLVVGFLWEQRDELLREIGADARSTPARNTAKRLSLLASRKDALLRARASVRSFTIDGVEYEFRDLVEAPANAREPFDAHMRREAKKNLGGGEKAVTNQLDLIVHSAT